MTKPVDFYFSPVSPWTYLGMARFRAMTARAGAQVHYKPVHLARIFETIALPPLPQRPEPLQRHRMQELRRWRAYLGIPINLQPRHFPTDPTPACRLIAAAVLQGRDPAQLSEACMAACWMEERDIADRATLVEIAGRCGFDGAALAEEAGRDAALRLVDANTGEAIARGVIGSPSYVIGDEVLFGQDRLEFVARELGLGG